MSYNQFAWYYDSLMDAQFYQDYFHYIQQKVVYRDVLELGCGTGTMAEMIAPRARKMIGIDLSEEMIDIAIAKCHLENLEFKVGNMLTYHNDWPADLILCLCDSLNYVLGFENQKKVLENCYNNLQNHGTFIFDIHSQKKINDLFHDYQEEEESDDFYFYWSCRQTKPYQITHYVVIEDLVEDIRVEEKHVQESYPETWYFKALQEIGFKNIEVEDVFGDHLRLVFTARKEIEA